MKTLKLTTLTLIIGAFVQALHGQTLIDNGNFSQGALGVNAPSGGGSIDNIDSTTIPDFRVFNIGDNGITLNVREVNIAGLSDTTTGIRVDVSNPNGINEGASGIDIANDSISTTPGTIYTLTFDAALISGAGTLLVNIQGFSGTGGQNADLGSAVGPFARENFLISNVASTVNGDPTGNGPYGNLVQYSLSYIAPPGANSADIAFLPASGVIENDAFAITHITFTAVPEPSTWALLMSGAAVLVGVTMRRRRCGQN
jgi:PEP-CTERM motif